jgi:hypothetical protein
VFNIRLHVGTYVLLKYVTHCRVGCHIVDVTHFVSVCVFDSFSADRAGRYKFHL